MFYVRLENGQHFFDVAPKIHNNNSGFQSLIVVFNSSDASTIFNFSVSFGLNPYMNISQDAFKNVHFWGLNTESENHRYRKDTLIMSLLTEYLPNRTLPDEFEVESNWLAIQFLVNASHNPHLDFSANFRNSTVEFNDTSRDDHKEFNFNLGKIQELLGPQQDVNFQEAFEDKFPMVSKQHEPFATLALSSVLANIVLHKNNKNISNNNKNMRFLLAGSVCNNRSSFYHDGFSSLVVVMWSPDLFMDIAWHWLQLQLQQQNEQKQTGTHAGMMMTSGNAGWIPDFFGSQNFQISTAPSILLPLRQLMKFSAAKKSDALVKRQHCRTRERIFKSDLAKVGCMVSSSVFHNKSEWARRAA